MRVCILSDSHDNWDYFAAAVGQAKAQGAEAVLHCGDVCAPKTLTMAFEHGLPMHVIHGNNTGDLWMMGRLAARPGSLIHYHGQDAELTLGGRRVFLVHYPHYAYGMALTGRYDVVCCGHDHQLAVRRVEDVRGGQTYVVNPGTVAGLGAPPTYILGDLEAMTFEPCEVSLTRA
jgi:putative phosphoesterase